MMLERRAIVKRNVVEDWGESLQRWVQLRPPAAVFALAIVGAFLFAVVLLSLVWETVRKCRASHRAARDRERAEWLELPDGSSVLTSGRRVPDSASGGRGLYKPGTFIGPMSSLIRDARESTGVGSRYPEQPHYVPTQVQMPYDPPLDPSSHARHSTGSASRWSEQTKVEPEYASHDEKKVRASDTLPESRPGPLIFSAAVPSLPPPPPQRQPATPANSTSTPLVRPLGVGHTRQASSSGGFQPKDLHLVHHTSSPKTSPPLAPVVVGGESDFSTPKPTSLGGGGRRGGGWSVPSFVAASPAPSASSTGTTTTTMTSVFPPRVDLHRTGTWSSSISSWFPPSLGGGGGSSDKSKVSDSTAADKDEDETTKLVDRALNDAR